MSDESELASETNEQIDHATNEFEQVWETETNPGAVVREFGEMLTDVAGGLGEFGDGLGELVEERAHTQVHLGSGVLQTTGEAVFAVIGEVAEAGVEGAMHVSEHIVGSIGGAIESAGAVLEHVVDGAEELAAGHVSNAVDHAGEAVHEGEALAEADLDTKGAVIAGTLEMIEGFGAVGREIAEGTAEIAVAAAHSAGDFAEEAWDAINPFD